jgi:hypothetical protein
VGQRVLRAGASTPVTCFRTEQSATRFWGGLTVPTTRAESLRYVPKAVAYARRCGELSGRLLAHISTEDTARDLIYLRSLLHQRQLTYLGWSCGSFPGMATPGTDPGDRHHARSQYLLR